MANDLNAEIKRLMALGMSEAEARETALYDAEIDADPKEKKQLAYDLSAEQAKVAKQYKNTGSKKRTYTFTQRERKPNEPKRKLIEILRQALENEQIEAVVSNIERQIDFNYEGQAFSFTLTAHRPEKPSKK